MSTLHRSLSLTSMVCEAGSSLEQFKHIVFNEGAVRAFNGLVHLQAPSGLDKDLHFAVSFDRLSVALRALAGEEFEVALKPEFLVLKKAPLTIRVRKLAAENMYQSEIKLPPKSERTPAEGFLDALRKVAPFVSADASRPWSISALLRANYIWATNNLALVRYPFKAATSLCIPSQAVSLLLELKDVDWIASQEKQIVVGCGEAVLAFPQSASEWPDVMPFFNAMPKRLPKADPILTDAASTIEKFSERFVTLTDRSVETKLASLESEYEVNLPKGKGTYNARLFSLVAAHATNIDFGTYPKPVFFASGAMDGVMVGVAPEQVPK